MEYPAGWAIQNSTFYFRSVILFLSRFWRIWCRWLGDLGKLQRTNVEIKEILKFQDGRC